MISLLHRHPSLPERPSSLRLAVRRHGVAHLEAVFIFWGTRFLIIWLVSFNCSRLVGHCSDSGGERWAVEPDVLRNRF